MEFRKNKTKLFFDTETTGLPAKELHWEKDFDQYPYLVQIAWVVGDEEVEYLIKPDGFEIPQEATDVHGISQDQATREGVDLKLVLKSFFYDVENSDQIIGHNIYFDTSIIKANALRLGFDLDRVKKALDKDKRFDTMYKSMKPMRVGKWPKLGEAYDFFFHEEIKDQHTALADVKATQRVYNRLMALESDQEIIDDKIRDEAKEE